MLQNILECIFRLGVHFFDLFSSSQNSGISGITLLVPAVKTLFSSTASEDHDMHRYVREGRKQQQQLGYKMTAQKSFVGFTFP